MPRTVDDLTALKLTDATTRLRVMAEGVAMEEKVQTGETPNADAMTWVADLLDAATVETRSRRVGRKLARLVTPWM